MSPAMRLCLRQYGLQRRSWSSWQVTLQIIPQKKFRDKCGTYDIPLVIAFHRDELGASIGKDQRVVLAVTDKGFAEMISRTLGDTVGGGVID